VDTLRLLEEPFTFTQRRPLLTSDFLSEGRKLGLALSAQELEAFHRVRLLIPLYRIRRDGREIAAAHRRGQDAYVLAHWQPTSRRDLAAAANSDQLHDPAAEAFIARRRLRRTLGEWSYDTSVYLYGAHQLSSLPLLGEARPRLKLHRRGDQLVGRLGVDAVLGTAWRERAATERQIAIAATLLEPIYHGRIFHQLSLPHEADFASFDRWQRTRALLRPLRLLGVKPPWLRQAAESLHWRAHVIDPLGEWAEVVAAGSPSKWKSLSGDARAALELRLSAELLLLYYDDLHRAGKAPALPEVPSRMRGPLDDRLRRRRPLDALLTDFDLSPHPHLVLAVEGETERLIFPRAMRLLGLRTDDDFIALEDAGGVDRDLSPLVAYAVAPRFEEPPRDGGRYVRLQRPPTRLLVVFDAEGHFATPATRRARRDLWVKRLMRTLPSDLQTTVVEAQVRRLVTVTTWTRTGTSFELAHFTNTEIATASARLDERRRQPSPAERLHLVAAARASSGNLDSLLGPISKVALADELWPVLEQKIETALARRTERRIPIVRILDTAAALANELPRRNLVIALERQRRARR
jgi:hypothetical protein